MVFPANICLLKCIQLLRKGWFTITIITVTFWVYFATWFKIIRTILKIQIHWDKPRIFFFMELGLLGLSNIAAALGPPYILRQLRRPNLASNNSGI